MDDTLSLMPSEGHIFGVLKRIFGCRREEVMERRRLLHETELYNFYLLDQQCIMVE